MNRNSEIDKRYYEGQTAFEKLLGHPDAQISDASLDVLVELKKQRQKYFEGLVPPQIVQPVPVEKYQPRIVDLGLKHAELDAAKTSLAEMVERGGCKIITYRG